MNTLQWIAIITSALTIGLSLTAVFLYLREEKEKNR